MKASLIGPKTHPIPSWLMLVSLRPRLAACVGARAVLYKNYLAKVGRRGPPWGGGLLAWQAQYFLHSDAVSRVAGAIYFLHSDDVSRVAGAIYFLHFDAVSRGRRSTLYYLAKVGRRGAAVFLRGRRNAFCTQMLFRVAGAVLSALRCCFAWRAVLYITLRRSAAVGRRGAAVFLRGRRNTFCTPMLFRVAGRRGALCTPTRFRVAGAVL